MFKHVSFYRLSKTPEADLSQWDAELQKVAFVEPGPNQQMSAGFIPPRAQVKPKRSLPGLGQAEKAEVAATTSGAPAWDADDKPDGANAAAEQVASTYPMVECIGGEIILAFRVDTRSVPGSAIKERVEEKCDAIEQSTGRRPGRKQQKDLKEEALQELLPYAFTKTSVTRIWISRKGKMVIMDTTSDRRRDAVATALVRALDGLALTMLSTKEAPTTCMTHWLGTSEAPTNFSVDRNCEMRASDSTNSKVVYKNHSLDTEDIELHMKQGKVVTKLALTWKERCSFMLDEQGNMQKIELLDVIFEERKSAGADDPFDANVAIFTGEMLSLIPDLVDALGGTVDEDFQASAESTVAAPAVARDEISLTVASGLPALA